MTITKRGLDGLFLLFGVVALAAAGVLFALGRQPVAASLANSNTAAPVLAPNVISGKVSWKASGAPAASARVVASEPNSKQVVGETLTDAEGNYMLLMGVGTWLVEVPTAQTYYGYGQMVTVLPHESYTLDFGVTDRAPDPPTATPAPPTAIPPTREAVAVAPIDVPAIEPPAGTTNGGSTTAPDQAPPSTGATSGELPQTGFSDGNFLPELLLVVLGILSLAVGAVMRVRRVGMHGGVLTSLTLAVAGIVLSKSASRRATSYRGLRKDRS